MDDFKLHHGGLPIGLLSAIIVTVVLFVALPMLTQHQSVRKKTERISGMMISTKKPPKPPSEDRDKPKKQEMKKKETQKELKQTRRAQPKFVTPKISMGAGGAGMGGIKISQVKSFNVSDSLFMSAFNMNEVDQRPRVVRSFPPQYPYLAKRDNITGKIMLKFVVDVDGTAKEAEVVSADPPDVLDVFKDAALKAVERYKFKPAMKGGKAVMCIVKLPISFTLE